MTCQFDGVCSTLTAAFQSSQMLQWYEEVQQGSYIHPVTKDHSFDHITCRIYQRLLLVGFVIWQYTYTIHIIYHLFHSSAVIKGGDAGMKESLTYLDPQVGRPVIQRPFSRALALCFLLFACRLPRRGMWKFNVDSEKSSRLHRGQLLVTTL